MSRVIFTAEEMEHMELVGKMYRIKEDTPESEREKMKATDEVYFEGYGRHLFVDFVEEGED